MTKFEQGVFGLAILVMLIANGWILWHLLLWADRHGYVSLFGR